MKKPIATPHVVIKRGEESGLVYLEINDEEHILDPQLAMDIGESLYTTGADARATYEAGQKARE